MKRRPNVVLCLCDQLRSFEVGCYGNPVVRTPHIDALAGQGVRCDLAVSNNPVCMPARSLLLAGQYSRSCMGQLGNHLDHDAQGRPAMPEYPVAGRPHLPQPTLAHVLAQHGYHTAAIGKWHIHSTPADLGFASSLIPRVHHRHTGQQFRADGSAEFAVDGFSPDYEAAQVGQFLDSRQGSDDPFFLYYNISPPHMPVCDLPEKYLQMYRPEDVPLRGNVFRDGKIAHDPEWFRIYCWDFLYYQERLAHTRDLPADFDLRALTALYYGAVTWVDDLLGTLLANLRRCQLDDDTIVVFTSDHGDMLGSHHLFNKGVLFEESIRIPLIFRGPAGGNTHCELAPAVTSTQVASLVDVMPTLLELCGLTVPRYVQGRSLAPVLGCATSALDENYVFIETGGDGVGIRTPTHLLGLPYVSGDPRSLATQPHLFYDLTRDPLQQHNLAGSDQQCLSADQLQQLLRVWHLSTPWLQPCSSSSSAA